MRLTLLIAMMTVIGGCSQLQSQQQSLSSSANVVGPGNPAVAGGGANVPGQGSSSVPTANGVVARITNGLQGNVSPMAGNFAKSLAQVQGNLPKVTDPTKATGFDQVQLLIYAACSDLTTGGTPGMQSKYSVTPSGTIASNQGALIAAGMKMMDQYTASLASQGPSSAQVTAAFTTLLSTLQADSTNTSTIAFMSVCMAANTAGSSLMGF